MADIAGPDTYVRLALPRDIDAVAALQARAWRAGYADLLPADVLDRLEPAARTQWHLAVSAAPTDAHHLLVAVVRGGDEELIAGFAAVGPSEDEEADPHHVGALGVLAVDPARRGDGHGSRLLTAAVETMRTSRFESARCWLPEADLAIQQLLTSSGWALDGSRRELDTGADPFVEVRLHTLLH